MMCVHCTGTFSFVEEQVWCAHRVWFDNMLNSHTFYSSEYLMLELENKMKV
jgi:hypothetical protein